MNRYPCRIIRGNREEYIFSQRKNPDVNWKKGSRFGSLFYTYNEMKNEDMDYFEALPIYRVASFDGVEEFEMCHGSITQSRGMVLPWNKEMKETFKSMKTRLMLCAHSHRAFICREGDKLIVNGGSVGLPTDRQNKAEFAILDYTDGKWSAELVKVEYDIDAVIAEFKECGFLDTAGVWARAVVKTLRTGKCYTIPCIGVADSISSSKGMDINSEAVWEDVALKLGL